MRSELLIEIGVEELPSSYIRPAAEQFLANLSEMLKEVEITFGTSELFYTPRRIAVLIRKIAMYEKKKKRKIFGPPVKTAFDESGKPTKAALGFAESFGKTVKEIGICERKNKKVCCLEFEDKPKSTKDIIKEHLAKVIESISFRRKMRWDESGFEFARPIRWIVVILGKNSLKVKVAGVISSRKSFSPRFQSSARINLGDALSYEKIMEENHIIVSFKKRIKMVEDGIRSLLKSNEILVKNKDLLEEVTNLVEYPTVFRGNFEMEFIALPKDVIIAAMKEHQRYFSVENSEGKLMPFYLGVSNSPGDNLSEITVNNNCVLRARLKDAKFYWTEDLKKPLGDRVQELKGVEWHRGLGSVFDKTKRLVLLSLYLCRTIGRGSEESIKRGALLSKADLVTNMVKDGKEFTKLEGIIGREYAIKSGEKKEVAKVIGDHYLPRNALDKLPSTIEAAIVGISDRIDTLVGNFLAGEEPTGSEDPFGLRRSANGLLRIIWKFKLSFNLHDAISKTIFLYTSQENISIQVDTEKTKKGLINFVFTKLLTFLETKKTRYDIANAILSVYKDDIYVAILRINALSEARKSPDFEKLVIGQRRVANILKGIKNPNLDVKKTLFENKEELQLWQHIRELKEAYYQSLGEHSFVKSIEILLSFRPFIDNFFDNTLVMSDDEKRKNNRVALLLEVKNLFLMFADFSIIVVEKGDRKKV